MTTEIGTDGVNDVLTASGGSGNTLAGAGGNDVLFGGSGNDFFDIDIGTLTGLYTGIDKMQGYGGNDTYRVDNISDQVVELAGGGVDIILASVSYTLSTNVENLTMLDGAITGTGNASANTIIGNGTDNIINGGAGADYMDGFDAGGDTFVVDNALDIVTGVSTNTDDISTVISSVSFSANDIDLLSALDDTRVYISNVTLTGTAAIDAIGNTRANVLVGNSASNTLDGGMGATLSNGDGNDTLNGGGGADRMIGGDGDDVYFVDNAGDVIVEGVLLTDGADTIKSTITTDLRLANFDNVENLYLIGTANINGIATNNGNAITGNSGRNTITGGTGGDILSGGTNTGTAGDRLVGGAGDDSYIIFNANDVVIEGAGGGIDQLTVFTNFSLSSTALAAQEIENLSLAGNAVIGTGNQLVNVIVGNELDNTLDGGQNAAGLYDTLAGGDGDDIYIVRNEGLLPGEGDFVDEILDQGNDTVQATFNYTLTTFVENLVLLGTANLNGTGNNFDNTITGNAGNNSLDGALGADTLIGGLGNDTYVVDEIGDVVSEAGGGGFADSVRSSISYTLGDNLENLTLTGVIAIDGTGNSTANVIIGNGAANTLDGAGGVDTMAGLGGDDYYFVDDSGDVILETGGIDTVAASVTYTLGDPLLENLVLTGSGNINGTGNASNNAITGNDGNNSLDGMGGTDTLTGGVGNDTYVIDTSADIVSENAGEGTDTVLADLAAADTYVLTADVENLTLIGTNAAHGTGNTLDNVLTGNSAANTLISGVGNDTLNGGLGADALIGGTGDDFYVVDNAGDTITELVGEGTDTVSSNTTFTLSGNLENLVLTGAANINGTGDTGNNVITGNTGINVLTGNDGSDTLDGGTGADTMIGGLGDDTFYVDNINDVVVEGAGGGSGNDTVITFATTTLSGNIENLTLSGTAAINGTGDGGANLITGNAGKNILSGLGGADTLDGGLGADTMIGGLGNDVFIIDNIADKVTEVAGEGVDTVRSSLATYTLVANVDNLELSGTANINGVGNADANTLTGNIGNNTLNGGAGADSLIGGDGDDVFIIDDAGDRVDEDFGEGTDTVQSAFAVDLGSGFFNNVENLVLTGTAAIDGDGNGGNNTLTGNAGVNTLTGGAGDDTYIASSNDTIVEFDMGGNDTLIVTVTGTFVIPLFIENVIFTGTGAGNATGNAEANTLTGNAGNNTLDGGAGNDLMSGGKGTDVYIVDSSGDVVFEAAGEGTDTVRASDNYALSANVENLVLTGTGDIEGTGNNSDNTITGNSGDNTLDGGAGTDRLVGGAGDDVYIVDNLRDVIVEGTGNDTVMTGITYTLTLAALDNLILTGTNDVNGTGNAVVNILTGNTGDNTLNGGAANDTLFGDDGDDVLIGGTGADIMNGGDGDDSYFVDNANDLIIDIATEGDDSLSVSVNYTLSATAEIETVTLSGTSALHFTGSDTDNTVTGNSGANSIDGADGDDFISGLGGNDILMGGLGDDILAGGIGVDRMTGGAGADTFVFDAPAIPTNADTVTDFDAALDKIDISALMTDYDPLTDILSDWVQITGGVNSILKVNTAGTGFGGGTGYTTVATFTGANGLTGEQQLVDDGILIIS
ncbi:MAG: calcium-binding protein [bacterium]|nr:calcium-binding protein [bacterium]